MTGNNVSIIEMAFKDFSNEIYDKTEKRLVRWCKDLVASAVRMRLGDPKAHNFTGNLLNSIVVCLYRDGSPVMAFFAAEEGNVKTAIMRKMTARTRPYTFYRNGDYDGRPSNYVATVQTDKGWGVDDAKEFFASFRPDGKNMFDIVVAYTVEYANWVQMERNTTGILETRGYALKTGQTFMELKAA